MTPASRPSAPPLPARELPMLPLVHLGTVVCALALLVVWAVPEFHSGDREWWPYACAFGTALGLIGWMYLLRGRGNAAGARLRTSDPARHSPAASPGDSPTT